MKTISDFKRALTVGSMWRVIWPDGTSKDRPVCKVQSNGVYFDLMDGRKSFLDFPKSSEFKVNQHGQIEIYAPASNNPHFQYEMRLILTYEQI